MPCTPPPGGVDDEQMYSPARGVPYSRAVGRSKSCRKSCARNRFVRRIPGDEHTRGNLMIRFDGRMLDDEFHVARTHGLDDHPQTCRDGGSFLISMILTAVRERGGERRRHCAEQ
jgi:hypothetical protein